jgi:uncharacterized membrane-anchored protein YitT (DUF2179 family)
MKKDELFKWTWSQAGQALFGEVLFALAVNLFIVPFGLYNGGIIGISQLIRTFLINVFNIHVSFDFAGIINFLINVPLFILAYRHISKTFFYRTVFCVVIQTIALTVIPVPELPLVDEMITSVLIGGVLGGVGGGLILSAAASGGGTDIIGVLLTLKNRNLSVGKIGLSINVIVYTICGLLYGIQIMIYSIIYTAISSLMVDNLHEQNICSTAIIFTKKKPTKIIDFIKTELDRDVTWWHGIGSHDETTTYICYAVLSKYELMRLERHLSVIDSSAFVVKQDRVGIRGNFQKKLT